jgi:hypothetical protein
MWGLFTIFVNIPHMNGLLPVGGRAEASCPIRAERLRTYHIVPGDVVTDSRAPGRL